MPTAQLESLKKKLWCQRCFVCFIKLPTGSGMIFSITTRKKSRKIIFWSLELNTSWDDKSMSDPEIRPGRKSPGLRPISRASGLSPPPRGIPFIKPAILSDGSANTTRKQCSNSMWFQPRPARQQERETGDRERENTNLQEPHASQGGRVSGQTKQLIVSSLHHKMGNWAPEGKCCGDPFGTVAKHLAYFVILHGRIAPGLPLRVQALFLGDYWCLPNLKKAGSFVGKAGFGGSHAETPCLLGGPLHLCWGYALLKCLSVSTHGKCFQLCFGPFWSSVSAIISFWNQPLLFEEEAFLMGHGACTLACCYKSYYWNNFMVI